MPSPPEFWRSLSCPLVAPRRIVGRYSALDRSPGLILLHRPLLEDGEELIPVECGHPEPDRSAGDTQRLPRREEGGHVRKALGAEVEAVVHASFWRHLSHTETSRCVPSSSAVTTRADLGALPLSAEATRRPRRS
jgi:hypothetical protein